MTLAALRNTEQIDAAAIPTIYEPVCATDILYAGGMVCLTAAGLAAPAASVAGMTAVVGRGERTVDNTAAGTPTIKVMPGQFKYDNNGDSIVAADVGSLCYAVDDEAVDISNAGGRPIAGLITRVDGDGVVFQTQFHIAGIVAAVGAAAGGDSAPVYHVDVASTADVANLAAFVVTHDGIVMVEGERFLAKNQAAPAENGIYVVGVVAGTAPLTRALDFDDGSEFISNSVVVVERGTANADTAWGVTTDGDIVVGTTGTVWAEVAFGYGAAGAMVDQTIAADDAGVALTAARIDHNHNFTAAAGADTHLTGAEGAAASFSRSDHTHVVLGVPTVLRTVTLTSADLTAAGVAQTINIGAVLLQTDIVLGYRIDLVDAFDNGAMANIALEVGHSNDPDAYEDGFDVFTGSALEGDGLTFTTPGPGIGLPAFDGTSVGQCVAVFTANADQLLNCTNGELQIDIIGCSLV